MMQSPVEIGSMLAGKYRIERVIGQGGMGIVVAAMHDELDQRVAIKFLSPESAKGTEWIARFAREAKTAAKIKNEHAVKVYDVGRLDTGIPYMVMEYLEGRNLDELLEEHRVLPIEEAADYILQACEALAEAHLVGIVHRDLKPANLFLTYRGDGSACVKILDFGISKVDESLAIGAAVTHTTSLVGSPLYMSPERLKGAKDVDRRADIWSLGVMLQEMITGSPPFLADTIPEIHAMVLTMAPTPLQRGCPQASAELDALVLKCLEKSADARFQNVLEFATALGALSPALQPSVDRIGRIAMGTSGARARVSMLPSSSASGTFPPSLAANPRLAVTAAAAELADETRDSGRVSAPLVPPSRESLPTVSATGTLGDALKKSTGKFAMIGAAAVVIVVLATFMTVRRHGTSEPSSAASTFGAVKAATALGPPEAPPTAMTTNAPASTTSVDQALTTDSARGDDADAKSHGTLRGLPKHRLPKTVASGSAVTPASSTTAAPSAPPQDPNLIIDYGGRN